MDCKLHWYPKFYNHDILFVGSKTFGTFIKILFVGILTSSTSPEGVF